MLALQRWSHVITVFPRGPQLHHSQKSLEWKKGDDGETDWESVASQEKQALASFFIKVLAQKLPLSMYEIAAMLKI